MQRRREREDARSLAEAVIEVESCRRLLLLQKRVVARGGRFLDLSDYATNCTVLIFYYYLFVIYIVSVNIP